MDLDREFLTIEAAGDDARAMALMAKHVVIRSDVQKALDKMKGGAERHRPGLCNHHCIESRRKK
jgi:hypothetical protein